LPGPTNSSPEPVDSTPESSSPTNNGLMTSAEMGQADGGSWSSDAASLQSLRFSCFPLPASPAKSSAEELSEMLGARFYEVVDTFPSTAAASQAYVNFASAVNNCQWQNSNEGTTSQFTAVADSGAQNLDSASTLWDIQGTPIGNLNIQPSHDGAICAVRSGSLDAFAFIIVDSSNSPTMTELESSIEPAMANEL
jgi:hypothetical protein